MKLTKEQQNTLKESMQRALKIAHIVHKNKPLKPLKILRAKIINNKYVFY